MPDFTTWTPYVQGAAVAVAAWLIKSQIQTGQDVIELRTTMKYYVEHQTKDAAIRLEQLANPTPPDMQVLLQKYRIGSIDEDERLELVSWLTNIAVDLKVESAERSAALQLLTGIKTTKRFKPQRRWWQFA